MRRIKLTPEQKQMILGLSIKDKDKLLLRLVVKEPLLVEQLSFQHIEAGSTTDERASDVEAKVRAILSADRSTNPIRLMFDLRAASSAITHHERVTKDKFGEVTLLVDAFHFALDHHLASMRRQQRDRVGWHKLGVYISKRLLAIMAKASKLHPDLHLEFSGQLNDLLLLIHDTPELNEGAEEVGLPRAWG